MSAIAGSRNSANYSILADTTDAGGQRAASANYSNSGSASLLAGVSTVAAPAEAAKSGYIAQLYDVSGLLVNSATPDVNETETLQLAAWQLLDDATFLATDASTVAWGIVSGPITDVSASGLATAGPVFQNTSATVQGTFGGFTGSLNLTVLDSIPDNFGAYAGDGIGDDWQVQYFGENNPLAAPALDPDGDGQTNQFEFTAGLIPNDPASVFHLLIAPVPGQPSRRKIIFSPRLDGRTYTVQSRLTLGGAWQPLGSSTVSDNGDERTVTDLNAAGAGKFYRVEITLP
jgi:hypothetical protein